MVMDKVYVFEVLDNFFGSQDYPPAETIGNSRIRDLQMHITTFYDTYRISSVGDFQTRLFLGSFLSSPPISIESAPYLTSALLCADSIILFDPLHYWFCDEQYQRDRLMSAPTGWKTQQEKRTVSGNKRVFRPDYLATKKYLEQALRWLSSIRPLVEAGIVVLVPAEQIVLSKIKTINQFSAGIQSNLSPLEKLANSFEPEEITVDDNRKGLFVHTGGDRDYQIRDAIGKGIKHFAKDVIIANATGSLYTAPFKWEQHLGKASLDGFAAAECKTKVAEGIRNLRLPIFSNLSPELIVKIHNDSEYSLFRASFVEALQNIQEEIGSVNFVKRVQQIESDILQPRVKAILRETRSNTFRNVTGAVEEGAFTFFQTFLGNAPTGLSAEVNTKVSAISGGLSFARKLIKDIWEKRDHRLWTQLLPQNPTPSIYGLPLMLKQQENVGWSIDEKPSLSVTVSKGILKR
jgi:hypothetical protein